MEELAACSLHLSSNIPRNDQMILDNYERRATALNVWDVEPVPGKKKEHKSSGSSPWSGKDFVKTAIHRVLTSHYRHEVDRDISCAVRLGGSDSSGSRDSTFFPFP